MLKQKRLNPHPRLYAGRENWERLKKVPRLPFLKQANAQLSEMADEYLEGTTFPYSTDSHNAHLGRARIIQGRVVSLLARWIQTEDRKYRDAAMEHVRQIGEWEYWAWITWRKNDPRPDAIFDLSYGENCATLAIAFDWLHDTLTDEECSVFVSCARERALKSFLVHTKKGNMAWWHGKPDSNWNTVCAGGAGMLALAMWEELREAETVVRRVEASFVPFMKVLTETGGGWPEGIGYWNYGMRYAFMYLLSHERAFGKKHPLITQSATAKTLSFTLDLCPNGVPCSFGDVNHWSPLPFHFAAAERLKQVDVMAALHARHDSRNLPKNGWPHCAEWMLFHTGNVPKPAPKSKAYLKLFRGLDWGVLADQMPNPKIYLSVRGGTTEVPHGHRDLLSFHCVVEDEALISNVGVGEYLDTTFSSRRYELFETTPQSKNTILINGVGVAGQTEVKTSKVRLANGQGFRMDATSAMGGMRDARAARFCGRLFLLLSDNNVLIIDRIEPTHFGRVESRMHSYGAVEPFETHAVIKGERQSLAVSYAADVPSTFHQADGAPTTPGHAATMLRWCTDRLHREVTFVTLLTPGETSSDLKLSVDRNRISVRVKGPRRAIEVKVTARLRSTR